MQQPAPSATQESDTTTKCAAQKERIRILEFQVDHLRGELEDLTRRHHREIYSIAWWVGWPVRKIENALRKSSIKEKPPALKASQVSAAKVSAPQPVDGAALAARILARVRDNG